MRLERSFLVSQGNNMFGVKYAPKKRAFYRVVQKKSTSKLKLKPGIAFFVSIFFFFSSTFTHVIDSSYFWVPYFFQFDFYKLKNYMFKRARDFIRLKVIFISKDIRAKNVNNPFKSRYTFSGSRKDLKPSTICTLGEKKVTSETEKAHFKLYFGKRCYNN